MGQTQRVSKNNTTIKTSDDTTFITLHNTDVVAFDSKLIILRCNGWFTVNTKTRMNQASNQFNLGYQVYQKDHEWFVDFKGKTVVFYDGITLTR